MGKHGLKMGPSRRGGGEVGLLGGLTALCEGFKSQLDMIDPKDGECSIISN